MYHRVTSNSINDYIKVTIILNSPAFSSLNATCLQICKTFEIPSIEHDWTKQLCDLINNSVKRRKSSLFFASSSKLLVFSNNFVPKIDEFENIFTNFAKSSLLEGLNIVYCLLFELSDYRKQFKKIIRN